MRILLDLVGDGLETVPHRRPTLTRCEQHRLADVLAELYPVRNSRRRHMVKDLRAWSALLVAVLALSAISAWAQAVGGAEKARPVPGDPGLSTMRVIDRPEFRVLRDYAEPGATRRLHAHADATYHVFVLVTGQLLLTIQGESPVEVTPGQVLDLKAGVMHTFKNSGSVTATIVEVFGKGPAKAGGNADVLALAQVLAAPR
jgi:mannose-6-phosphate isomerase-like protein (cupin superfamily)